MPLARTRTRNETLSKTQVKTNPVNKKTAVPPRRTQLSARSEKRVAALLSMARTVFAENGFEKTTTIDIAQRLGVSEATIFTYFSSKRELCMQVIKDWYDEISTELEREVPSIHGTRAQLQYVVRQHLRHLIKDGKGLCALVLSEGRSADNEFTGLIAEQKRRYIAPLMQVLAEAQTRGEIRPNTPLRLIRDMIYGSMEHVLWDFIVSGHEPDIDATTSDITDLLWSALLPPDLAQQSLAQFHTDIIDACRRYEEQASLPQHNPKSAKKKQVKASTGH